MGQPMVRPEKDRRDQWRAGRRKAGLDRRRFIVSRAVARIAKQPVPYAKPRILMNHPILKIERLSHRYSSSWAIRDINIEINRAGITGLLGSNGAGKSTIMNIMCGVLK